MGPRRSRGPIIRFEAPPSAARSHARLRVQLVALVAALALPAPAAGRAACGEAVLDDWFDDGRISVLYDLPCYGEAIEAIPADIRDYSDAEEIISRALQAAARGKLARGGADPTPGGAPRSGSELGITNLGGSSVHRAATAAVDPSGTSSLPIPLLVLAGLSLALLGAGAFGYLSRRRGDAGNANQDKRT